MLFPLMMLASCFGGGRCQSARNETRTSRTHDYNVRLPSDCCPDQLTAVLRHGLLELRVPKHVSTTHCATGSTAARSGEEEHSAAAGAASSVAVAPAEPSAAKPKA